MPGSNAVVSRAGEEVVHRHHPFEQRWFDRRDPLAHRHAGVVDQHVGDADQLDDPARERLDGIEVGEVGGDGLGAHARRRAVDRDLGQPVGPAGDQHDVGARGGNGAGRRRPDARRRTGHHHRPTRSDSIALHRAI